MKRTPAPSIPLMRNPGSTEYAITSTRGDVLGKGIRQQKTEAPAKTLLRADVGGVVGGNPSVGASYIDSRVLRIGTRSLPDTSGEPGIGYADAGRHAFGGGQRLIDDRSQSEDPGGHLVAFPIQAVMPAQLADVVPLEQEIPPHLPFNPETEVIAGGPLVVLGMNPVHGGPVGQGRIEVGKTGDNLESFGWKPVVPVEGRGHPAIDIELYCGWAAHPRADTFPPPCNSAPGLA